MVALEASGRLGCRPSECADADADDAGAGRPLVRDASDGRCYALGSRGPCSPAQLYGYDVFERRSGCVNVTDGDSPYFVGAAERAQLDATYKQLYVYDELRLPWPVAGPQQRQDLANSQGVFQVPGSLTQPLLVPCRSAPRSGNNYKCTNPLV